MILTLISHALCPFVQRVAIVLNEKGTTFERVDIDLDHKPQWFLDISPMGKTPVLKIDETPIFESSAICEYLEDTLPPALHPKDPLKRAQHRAWMEFGSNLLATIFGFYTATSELTADEKAREVRRLLEQVEEALGDGPYFAGEPFSIVDAVFAPAFRYFDAVPTSRDEALFAGLPKVDKWRAELAKRPSVKNAVTPEYADLLRKFLRAHGSVFA